MTLFINTLWVNLSSVAESLDCTLFVFLEGKTVDLHEYEAEAVSSLIKLYLRELPENILTAALVPKFNEISSK